MKSIFVQTIYDLEFCLVAVRFVVLLSIYVSVYPVGGGQFSNRTDIHIQNFDSHNVSGHILYVCFFCIFLFFFLLLFRKLARFCSPAK